MQIGLVGLPTSGKTTLFNLLTGSSHLTGISGADEAHIGSAEVPDPRISYLSGLYKPKKTTYTRIDFKDIPGVKMNDSRSRASRLLNEVRSADALVEVLRVFKSGDAEALAGDPDPYRDLTNYGAELQLADIDILEKRIARLQEASKTKKDSCEQVALLKKLLAALENDQLISSLQLSAEEKQLLAGQSFLSEKPLFLVVNIDEDQLRSSDYPNREKICAYAAEKEISIIEICARVEMEINRLKPEEQPEFLEDLGLAESGLSRLTRRVYEQLNLISFFTVGEDEVRAWTVEKGAPARQAAGKIHSDIERGFIRAEVFHYNHLYQLGSAAKVRDAGHFHLEGKEYPVQDGDIANFRFNV